MRKVLTNPMEQYAPGSVLGKMFNVRLNKINWAVLSDAADKLEGELASQPILAGRPKWATRAFIPRACAHHAHRDECASDGETPFAIERSAPVVPASRDVTASDGRRLRVSTRVSTARYPSPRVWCAPRC